MPIIAVMNRKGGSGKSTLATQIAAWYASKGVSVMLGDSDRQRSTSSWQSRRSSSAGAIAIWPNDLGRAFRTPCKASHLVVDTPGGIHGLELAKQVAQVDAIVVPVGPSVFDLETTIEFLQELSQHSRVAGGRCRVAVVGMRWPLDLIQAWENQSLPRPLPLLTIIAEATDYRLCMESGRSVFDADMQLRNSDLKQWQPLLDWLQALPQAGTVQGISRPHQPQAVTASRSFMATSPGKTARVSAQTRQVNQRQLRSPQSFVETMPPEGISPAELSAVQFQTRKRVALEMGLAVSPTLSPRQAISTSGESEGGWLTRLFRPR